MNQTIYFRKAVWDNFKDETDKSALVNDLLAHHYEIGTKVSKTIKQSITTSTPVAAVSYTEPPKPTKPINHTPGGVYMEMACCLMKTPCKHWAYEPMDAQWKNSLSGRVKEV